MNRYVVERLPFSGRFSVLDTEKQRYIGPKKSSPLGSGHESFETAEEAETWIKENLK